MAKGTNGAKKSKPSRSARAPRQVKTAPIVELDIEKVRTTTREAAEKAIAAKWPHWDRSSFDALQKDFGPRLSDKKTAARVHVEAIASALTTALRFLRRPVVAPGIPIDSDEDPNQTREREREARQRLRWMLIAMKADRLIARPFYAGDEGAPDGLWLAPSPRWRLVDEFRRGRSPADDRTMALFALAAGFFPDKAEAHMTDEQIIDLERRNIRAERLRQEGRQLSRRARAERIEKRRGN